MLAEEAASSKRQCFFPHITTSERLDCMRKSCVDSKSNPITCPFSTQCTKDS